MKVALAQINTTVGDFSANGRKILEYAQRAGDAGAELVVFPELTIHGYPPRDLLEFSDFVHGGRQAMSALAADLAGGPAALVGFVEPHARGEGWGRHNSLAWLQDGVAQTTARKVLLPNYDVFDERRYFDTGEHCATWDAHSVKWGLSICEDLWNDEGEDPLYARNPWQELTNQGCQWILNASASPYFVGKPAQRRRMFQASARKHGVGLILCNLVGGNDSLIFDGNSLVIDASGKIVAMGASMKEDLVVVDLGAEAVTTPPPPDEEELWNALVLGVRDYAGKTGFKKVVLGLSGGIDSALTAALAAEAMGAENVLSVAMPSKFTSSMSNEDAQALARNLGIGFEVIEIESIVRSYEGALDPQWGGTEPNVAEENLQARIRGNLLLGISNKHGHLVLTTGNKSELSVGYCTLYGDMAGGLSVIGDCSKTQVYRLSEYANRNGECIPQRILTRPPTAELRHDQKDEDSLPPYEELDPLLEALVVKRTSHEELLRQGVSAERLREVLSLLIRAEYKRRQGALSLKVSPRAFGEGWRFPISHRWRIDQDSVVLPEDSG